MKKIVSIIVGVLVVIGLAIFGFNAFKDSRSINGTWETGNVRDYVIKGLSQEELSGLSDMNIMAEQLIKSADMSLPVTDGKSNLALTVQMDIEAVHAALIKLRDDSIKSELEKEGIAYDSLSEEMKQAIAQQMPSDDDIRKTLTDALTETVKKVDGKYDSATGEYTATIFEGTVDPISSTIKLTSVNEKAISTLGLDLKSGDSVPYEKKGNTLIMAEDTDITFSKK